MGGCSTPESNELPGGVRFEVMQGRTDYANDTLVLRMINGGSTDVAISAASLTWDGFAEPATWVTSTELAPGRTVDLRTTVPTLNCDKSSADLDPSKLTVDIEADSPAGLTPDDPLGTLERLHNTGCTTARVDRVLTIGLDGPLRIEGAGAAAVAVLPLRFTPTGEEGAVTIDGVGSTPLLTPADGSDSWPLSVTVSVASAVQGVDLRIRPARCDSHALAEDKIGTVFVLRVEVAGVDGTYRYAVDDDTRNALYGFVKTVCGLP